MIWPSYYRLSEAVIGAQGLISFQHRLLKLKDTLYNTWMLNPYVVRTTRLLSRKVLLESVKPEFSYFSFGIVFLELGAWESVGAFTNSDSMRDSVRDCVRRVLGKTMELSKWAWQRLSCYCLDFNNNVVRKLSGYVVWWTGYIYGLW